MKNFFKIFLHILVILGLTILTQVGGLVYLSTIVISKIYNLRRTLALGIFIGTYLTATFILLPIIAPLTGRTALPMTEKLRPLNMMTCVLNRHYVTPQLKNQMLEIAESMDRMHKGTVTNYLDANFPFLNGFPLFPHLSHNDGKKLDLAFYYKEGNLPSHSAPSFIGYGVYEDPTGDEPDYPTICKQKGYLQYGLLSSLIPQWNKNKFELDVERTRDLILLLAKDPQTSKIFIEPHLKQRWHLNSLDNIRFTDVRQ